MSGLIRFSFDRNFSQIPEIALRNSSGEFQIGSLARAIIEAEGFNQNPLKFRVAGDFSRKVVTGLVVNKIVNVPRKWLKKLDGTIHAIAKFGTVANGVEFF